VGDACGERRQETVLLVVLLVIDVGVVEEGSQAADWDSDETVVEGSVTESDPEEEALPWRR
jgi:hypothetical protein